MRTVELWQWLFASVQSAAGYPVRLPGSPSIRDEVQLTSYLVQTAELSERIRAFGIDPEVIRSALERCAPAQRGSIRSALKVIHSARFMNVPEDQTSYATPRNLFWSQIRRGSPGIRAAIESAGIDLRALVFYLAHGEHESRYTVVPADLTGAKCGVEVLNDDFTAMEFVVNILTRCFGMVRADAIRFMLDTHRAGSAVLPQDSVARATQSVLAVNAEARQHYYPLLCRVVALH